MTRSVFLLTSAAAFLGLLTGCASYQLGDVKPSAYEGINRIYVKPFENKTLEPRLSSLVTNSVLKQLQADGTYEVGSSSNCDAVLVGEIKEIRKRQLRSVRTDTLRSQELSVFLFIDFRLEDPNTGRQIVSTQNDAVSDEGKEIEAREIYKARQGRVVGDTIQFVDKSFQVGERSALAIAAEDAAKKLVAQLANGW